jgi:hypothetical protein
MPFDASDGFRTLVLRINTATKSTVPEGFQTISQGDSLKLVLSELPGADLTSLKAYLFSKGTRPVAPATTPGIPDPNVYLSSALSALFAGVADLGADPTAGEIKAKLIEILGTLKQ